MLGKSGKKDMRSEWGNWMVFNIVFFSSDGSFTVDGRFYRANVRSCVWDCRKS